MSGLNWGGVAGGFVSGLERGQRMRLQREQAGREGERHQWDMQERQRVSEQRDRESNVWSELNALIAKRSQAQAPTPQVAAPGSAPAQEQPAAAPIDQGNGVETMPFQDTGAGLQARTLPAQEGMDTPTAGLQRVSTPAAPARAPAAAGPGDDGQKIGFALYQNTNLLRDPEFLNEAAQVFLKARMPEGVKWLERGFKAQQENGVDALKAFAAGNAQRGIQLFNASGQHKIEDAQPIREGPDKGKWSLRMAGVAQPVLMDPGADLKSFLDPKAYFDVINKERDDERAATKDGAEAELKREQARYYKRRGEIEQQNADSLRDYRLQTGDAATTRANRPPSGGGRGGTPPDALTSTRSAAVSREVERALTIDNGSGQGVLDRERAPFYKGIAAQLARQDPTLSAPEAADLAMSVPYITPKMAADQAKTELKALQSEVGILDKAGGIGSGGGFRQRFKMTEEEWTKGRVAEIIRKAEAEADAKLTELGVTRRRGDGTPVRPKVTPEAIAALRANPDRADEFRALFGVDPAQYLGQSASRPSSQQPAPARPADAEGPGLTRRGVAPAASAPPPLADGLTRRGDQVFRREGANEVLDRNATIAADPRVSFLRSDIAKAVAAQDLQKVGVLTKALNEYVTNKYGGWQ